MLQELGDRIQCARGAISERINPITVEVLVIRHPDCSYEAVVEPSDGLKEFYEDGGRNAVVIQVPKEAFDPEKRKFVGGKIAASPWGVYPLTARWFPEDQQAQP